MPNLHTETPDSEFLTETIASGSYDSEEQNESVSDKVAAFLRLCWGRRKKFTAIVASGMALSVLYAYLLPNQYTSITTLMPPDNASAFSNIMGMVNSSSSAAGLGAAALGLNSPGELFVSILESRNVQDGLIARFSLISYYHSRLPADARKTLKASTTVDEDRKSGVISISVSDRDPVLAAKLASGYVVELNRVVTDDSTSAARRERVFLEERLKDVTQDLDDSSKALSQFSTKNRTIDIPSQAKSMVDAGIKLDAELIDGRSELAALRQTYSEDNYRVKTIEARNAELQKQIDAMSGKPSSGASQSAESSSTYPSVSELPVLGLTYSDLERKVRADEAIWEALTKEYEAAKVEEAKQIPTVRVLDAAEVPQRKSSPVRRNILAVGTLFSIILACVFIAVGKRWDETASQTEPKKLISEVAGGLRWVRTRR